MLPITAPAVHADLRRSSSAVRCRVAFEGPGKFLRTVNISGREVGEDHPPFLVVEIGLNHNGDAGLAKGMVCPAAPTGADAVKFQTFLAERLVTAHAPVYGLNTDGLPRRQVDLYKSYELR